MLWGLAAIAAPILIHFWNQKKATTVNWAAMKWLVESQKLKAKGFRFEDLLLLLLRILAFVLLALILSKPLMDYFGKSSGESVGKIHILAKDKTTLESYKFELNEALSKNEAVYWIDDLTKKIDKIESDITEKETELSDIQNITRNTKLDFSKNTLCLYLPKNIDILSNPNVFLPENRKLYFANKAISHESKAMSAQEYIYVNEQNSLVKSSIIPSKKLITKKEIKIGIATKNEEEKQSLIAAFEAIKEVYGFPFVYSDQNSEIVIGDKILANTKNAELIIQTEGWPKTDAKVVSLNENLSIPNSTVVYRAELPEKILEILLKHYQLADSKAELSKQQLSNVFRTNKAQSSNNKMIIDKYLSMLLIGIVLTERWISLKNNK